MRLRLITGTILAFSFLMLIAWPWVIGPRPERGATKQAYRVYVQRASTYVGVMLISMLGAGICAVFVLRQAKEEYRVERVANMKLLIEGQSHGPRKTPDDEADA